MPKQFERRMSHHVTSSGRSHAKREFSESRQTQHRQSPSKSMPRRPNLDNLIDTFILGDLEAVLFGNRR